MLRPLVLLVAADRINHLHVDVHSETPEVFFSLSLGQLLIPRTSILLDVQCIYWSQCYKIQEKVDLPSRIEDQGLVFVYVCVCLDLQIGHFGTAGPCNGPL